MGIEVRNEFKVNILKRFKYEVRLDKERYVMKLQWKTSKVQLPKNYVQAEQRLQQFEMKLRYNYDGTCMEKGWIEEKKEMDGIPRKTWYIPHHAVYRDD
ncbi:hypothetical protein T01_12338 [Trichinella spiralis]|uniref:Uncharacterized protein n=1 Tax=Trichinella spiralis TaxID=6334 RepID=A0A0V1APU1_TRISP|nr:hypothetical protein T01_11633 [Trichinella spiralis]KRY29749.1 hypothetical protein T01_7351 [Trichinella spiralis]KRY40964.1 hypothetical protein T01_12338 [Trichinella spiralis]